MVMHILKSDLVLRELEHVQVDDPGTAYLFFYDKQGHQGLEQEAADAIRTHMEAAKDPVHYSQWRGFAPFLPRQVSARYSTAIELQAFSIGAEAAGGVGKGNGWHQRDWIC